MNPDAHIARRIVTGRLAGILFIVGALASIPANLLFRDPQVGVLNHVMVAIALVSGLGCLLAPWDRIPERVFHAVPVLASAEVALTVWAVGTHGPVFEWFFVLAAVFAAYAFERRRTIAIHMMLCTAAAALPIFYREDTIEQVARIGVLMPILWVATAVVMFLREGLVARQRELADLARRDPLTGVGNRRLLSEHLRYEIARHRRTNRKLAVLVLDLNRFKEVNDTLGHAAGDRLLSDVAETLVATVRDGDTVVRHGGDEFCIVAPETAATEAATLGGRIGEALALIEVLGSPLTATIGAAVFPEDAPTPELLLAAADNAERIAKSGRHRQMELEPEARLRIV
ncbi:MAG: GGDEF domain-containing protein [Solirubrobacteraceae bacterium]